MHLTFHLQLYRSLNHSIKKKKRKCLHVHEPFKNKLNIWTLRVTLSKLGTHLLPEIRKFILLAPSNNSY